MNTQRQQDSSHEQLLDDFVARSRLRSEVYQDVLKYAALESLRRPPPLSSAPPPRKKRIGEICWLATKKAGRWLTRQISNEFDEPPLPDDGGTSQQIITVYAPETESADFSPWILSNPFMIDQEK